MNQPDPPQRRQKMRDLRAGRGAAPLASDQEQVVASGPISRRDVYDLSESRALEAASQGVTVVAGFRLQVTAESLFVWSKPADLQVAAMDLIYGRLATVDPRIVYCRSSAIEIVGFVAGVAEPVEAEGVLGRVVSTFSEQFEVESRRVLLLPRLGAAFAEQAGFDGGALNGCTSTALAQTRPSSPFVMLNRLAEQRRVRDANLAVELSRAIEEHRLVPYFQPRTAGTQGALVGMEVSARWIGEDGERASPREFLRVAEMAGSIFEVSHAVRTQAVAKAAEWQARSWFSNRQLIFNLAPAEWCDDRFVPAMTALRDRYPDVALVAEIPDCDVLDIDAVTQKLDVLRTLEVGLVLDRVTASSLSLGRVQRLQLSGLTVGWEVVHSMVAEPMASLIASTAIKLAHTRSMTAAACQIETKEQLATAAGLGFDHVQGHVLAPPMPADDAVQILRAGNLTAERRGRGRGAQARLR